MSENLENLLGGSGFLILGLLGLYAITRLKNVRTFRSFAGAYLGAGFCVLVGLFYVLFGITHLISGK